MSDKADHNIAVQIYSDATATIRHYDSQRYEFVKICLTSSTFAIGLMSIDVEYLELDLLAVIVLMLIFVSFLANMKYTHLIGVQRNRASEASEIINELQGINASDIHRKAAIQSNKFVGSNFSISQLWNAVLGLLAILMLSIWLKSGL